MKGTLYRFAVACLILSAVVGVGCGDASGPASTAGATVAWSRDPEMSAVEIVVDLSSAHDGRIPVVVTAIGGRPTHFAIQSAWSDGYTIHDLRFTDGDGQSLPHTEERGRYRFDRGDAEVVKAVYEMELGGEGRHGNQGIVADDHALFDGRLFLLPQGAVSVGSARIRFDAPDGWTVGSPFREDDGWYYADAFRPELTAAVLGATCMGVGRFEHVTRRVAETEVRVAGYAGWEEAHRQVLADKTFRLVEYFHETFGFDLRAPYSVVWVPKQGRNRVFGGSFANGTCYEAPVDRLRNWELLAHRIAHAMNHYRPSGMRIRDDRDSWFDEGWASYMEAKATRAAGLVEGGPRWRTLHSSYRRTRAQFPERDMPLAREKKARGETREFLHYTKAPLAVRMLEHLVIERSGRDLEQFMADAWSRYGWYAKPFPVREELEAFSGSSFEDFWSLMVDSRGDAIPVWDGYLTPVRLGTMQQVPAASVGSESLRGDYLFHLAWSGDFRTFDAIRAFVEREVLRRQELDAHGVQLYPNRIREHLYALDPADRYAVARLEAAYPRELLSGAAHRESGEEVRFVANTDQADGRTFAELLAHEQREGWSAGPGERPWIDARTRNAVGSGAWRSRLGFNSSRPVQVVVSRVRGAESVEMELLSADEGGGTGSKLEVQPGATPTAMIAAADRRRAGRIVAVRLSVGDGAPVTRAFWQQASASLTLMESTKQPEDR